MKVKKFSKNFQDIIDLFNMKIQEIYGSFFYENIVSENIYLRGILNEKPIEHNFTLETIYDVILSFLKVKHDLPFEEVYPFFKEQKTVSIKTQLGEEITLKLTYYAIKTFMENVKRMDAHISTGKTLIRFNEPKIKELIEPDSDIDLWSIQFQKQPIKLLKEKIHFLQKELDSMIPTELLQYTHFQFNGMWYVHIFDETFVECIIFKDERHAFILRKKFDKTEKKYPVEHICDRKQYESQVIKPFVFRVCNPTEEELEDGIFYADYNEKLKWYMNYVICIESERKNLLRKLSYCQGMLDSLQRTRRWKIIEVQK